MASVLSALVLVPLHAVHQSASGASRSSLSRVTVTNQGAILSVLIVLIYTTALIGSRRGQSLGMMVARVKAVDGSAGSPIGYGRALGRGVLEYLMFVVLIVPWVLDMLFPLWDARRQTLHDKATNTVVVKARSRHSATQHRRVPAAPVYCVSIRISPSQLEFSCAVIVGRATPCDAR